MQSAVTHSPQACIPEIMLFKIHVSLLMDAMRNTHGIWCKHEHMTLYCQTTVLVLFLQYILHVMCTFTANVMTWNFTMHMHSLSKVYCFNIFERSLFCSPMLHLFDQNTVKTVILWNTIDISNSCFQCEYVLNCNLFLYFQHHYSSLQCHMIFRNHNNMLIYCSRNISNSVTKTVVLLNIFV